MELRYLPHMVVSAVIATGCGGGYHTQAVRVERTMSPTARSAIDAVAKRFAVVGTGLACRSVSTPGFMGFCRAYHAWPRRPLDFDHVGPVTLVNDEIAQAVVVFRSGGWIGLNLLRTSRGWRIDSEQTGASAGALGTRTRGLPLQEVIGG